MPKKQKRSGHEPVEPEVYQQYPNGYQAQQPPYQPAYQPTSNPYQQYPPPGMMQYPQPYQQPMYFPQPPGMVPYHPGFPMAPPMVGMGPFTPIPMSPGSLLRPGGGLVSNWWYRVRLGSEYKTTARENLVRLEQEESRRLERDAFIAETMHPYAVMAGLAEIQSRVAIFTEKVRQEQAATEKMLHENTILREKGELARIDRLRAAAEYNQMVQGPEDQGTDEEDDNE